MIWIIGDQGMLGREVSRLFDDTGIDYVGTDRELDMCYAEKVEEFISEHKPEWIINCAAYTAVDKAEEETELAHRLNAEGPAVLSAAAARHGAKMIQVSTDYVFGQVEPGTPLKEDQPVGPLSVYGSTKLEGEEAIQKNLKEHFIVRTAWLYGEFGNNFVYTMLKLLSEKDAIKVVNDQQGTPTWTKDLAGFFLSIIQSGSHEYGIYHYSGEGIISWYDFTCEIQRIGTELGLIRHDCTVNPCSSDEYPTPATRPVWSVFDKQKAKITLDVDIPDWKSSLSEFLKELKEQQNA